jgi:heat shock protein HslJ
MTVNDRFYTNRRNIPVKIQYLFIAIIFSLLLAACAGPAQMEPATPTPGTTAKTVAIEPAPVTEIAPVEAGAIPVEALMNATYRGIHPEPVTLTGGYAYYEEDGPGSPYVRLIDPLIVAGDLNGDGAEDAIVPLVDYTTGSGDFVYLAALLTPWSEPMMAEALMIGDRSPVKSLSIDGAQVIVELIGPGPGDPACCPTWNVRKVLALAGDRLVEQSSEELSKVSLDDLNGTSWRLVELNQDREPLLPEAGITLRFDDGQIGGSAGCNQYSSVVTGDEDFPQTFVVGPVAATKKACLGAIADQETIYLKALESVSQWSYEYGRLALYYGDGQGGFGRLLFAPQ